MFSSSVRRVVLAAPPIPLTSSISSTASRASASRSLSHRCHQRRLSSSKPSSPADGSKGVAEDQALSTAPAQRRPDGEKKSSTRTSRRKAKDPANIKSRDEALPNLPSVPSTQHIAPNQICASAFFSLHRPMSIAVNFPKAVTEDAFAAIFSPRTRANTKPSEVISTLSSTLENLDSATANMRSVNLGSQQDQWNAETDELRAAITAESYRRAEVQHLDNGAAESPMNFSRQILSGRYQPFSPPAAPEPMNTPESLAAGAEAAESQEPQHRTYTAVLTIEESTDENGEVTYLAHSSPLVVENPPATPTRFLERMNIRRERYREQRAEETGILAISVKRQRKLKMKKHKYKKLMKRTRNLRRKLDR